MTSGLGKLPGRFGLDAAATDRLTRLAALLSTDPEAPTTVTRPERVLDDHIADSLVALELPPVRSAGSLVDLGSGPGLPGLALAAALPTCQVSLVESNQRKCAFLERAIAACGIGNAQVRPERIESLAAERDRYDVATARALAPLPVVAEYAAPLLRVGGLLVAWRGKRDPEVEAEAARAAEVLGLSAQNPMPVQPYSTAENRFLHVMSKVSATPDRFPRRPGIAQKRPLGRRPPAIRSESDRPRR